MPVYQISSKELTYENIQHLMEEGWQIALSDEAIHKSNIAGIISITNLTCMPGQFMVSIRASVRYAR